MSKRLAIVLAAIVSGALIVSALIVVLALGAVQKSTQEADYRACVTAAGVYDTNDTGEMADIAERCYESVYGN